MRFLSRKELPLLFWGNASAIINTVKNNHIMHPIRVPMKNFFLCEYGVYMTDTQTDYRYNKEPLSFFVSHGETIPEEIVKSVEKFYLKKNFAKCREELEKVYPDLLKGKDFKSYYDLLYEIVLNTEHFAIDLDTEKYLPNMEAYSPQAMKKLYTVAQIARIGVESLNPKPLKPLIPIALALIIGLIGIALIQNLPKWIREIQEFITKPPPVEPTVPLQFIMSMLYHLNHF